MRDPMELTVEHIAQWRERMDTIGSSQAKGGRRKTFSLNANGIYLVCEHGPEAPLEVYRGTEAAEAAKTTRGKARSRQPQPREESSRP